MKYYAVKQGKKTGIFTDWDECKEQVHGYPNAIYKSFKNEDDAKAYLGAVEDKKDTVDPVVSMYDDIEKEHKTYYKDRVIGITNKRPMNFRNCDIKECIAFVDGSYEEKKEEPVGWGAILIDSFGEETAIEGRLRQGHTAESMRNVAGELLGTINAIKLAVELGMNKITIYHDYTGIKHWADSEWKTNNSYTKAYQEHIARVRDAGLEIKFVKVKAHTGDYYNEIADTLAGM